MIRSMSPSIVQTAMAFDSSLDLRGNLKERFAQPDIYRIADLQGEIFNMSQGSKTITDYFAVIQVLWDELNSQNPLPICVCDGCFCNVSESIRKKEEKNLVICFLRALNNSFSSLKSQIMASEPLPSMNKVFSLLIQFEREFHISDKNPVREIASFVKRGYCNPGFQS